MASAAVFGGEEGLECLVPPFKRNAGAAVADRNDDAVAVDRTFYRQFSALPALDIHRLDGVIDQRLEQQAHLQGTAGNRRQGNRRFPVDNDAGSEQARGADFQYIAQNFVEIEANNMFLRALRDDLAK